jgi:hypothetical protein
MITLLVLVSIVQSFSISLGVGSSTIAITSFFAAIADGTIEAAERKMLGVVYVVLRVSMVAILATTFVILFLNSFALSPYIIAQLIVIAILFVNAILMTAHIMPSTFGPAIQAGNWYTLGTLAALVPLELTNFTLLQFSLGYVTWIVLAIAIVNGIMAIMKPRKK